MKSLPVSAMAAALFTSACSSYVPIVGQMQKSEEALTGQIVGAGSRGGPGELTLVTKASVTCKGKFVYTNRRRAEGVLSCADGSSGAFHLASVGTSGTGAGDIGGLRFTFTFASPE